MNDGECEVCLNDEFEVVSSDCIMQVIKCTDCGNETIKMKEM